MFLQGRTSLLAVTLVLCLAGSAANARELQLADSDASHSQNVTVNSPDVEDLVAVLLDSPGRIALDRVAVLLSASATVEAELHVSVESGGSNSVTVAPGAVVSYEVVGVLSDDANEGLALFGFNLVFDGGDLAPADTPAGEPTPGCDNPMVNLTIPWGINNPGGYGGTVIDGDLIQVGGGQNTINNTPDNAPYPIGPVLTGVAQRSGCGPAVLVTGTLTAPDVEGTYTLALEELFANVIIEGETGDPFWATAAAGIGAVTNLSVSVSDDRAIPTLCEWGLVVMTLLLLTAGKVHFGRRHHVQA